MSSHQPLSLHKSHDIILNIKPQKQTTSKVLRFKQDKKPKQALKNGFRTCHQFPFVYLGILTNYLEPQKLISHLKQLKALRYLTLDLTYLLKIPKHYIPKIFIALRYIKSLSVLRFEHKRISYLLEPNFHELYRAIPIINSLSGVQVEFSLETWRMAIDEKTKLSTLLESFNKLERFTSVDKTFLRNVDIVPILEVIGTLKASKSLATFSVTFAKCRLFDSSSRLHELFLTLKEIKSLKNSKILFEECEAPRYKTLKTSISFIEEVGQKVNLRITFENYQHVFTTYH